MHNAATAAFTAIATTSRRMATTPQPPMLLRDAAAGQPEQSPNAQGATRVLGSVVLCQQAQSRRLTPDAHAHTISSAGLLPLWVPETVVVAGLELGPVTSRCRWQVRC